MFRRSKFTLISSVRDEGPYILEWVAHHRVLGFDRICMASNDCTDGSDELLASLAAAGFIEHLHQSVSPEESPQVVAYAKMRGQLSIDDTEWLMVLDVDEFLNVHIGDNRLRDLTDRAGDECDIISLHAMCFTGHGQQQWEPGPVCPRQQWRLPISHRANRAMKSLTRHPERFVDIHNHSVTRLKNGDPAALLIMFGDGRRSHPQPGIPLWQQLRNAPLQRGEYRLAYYNHYCVKTWDSFNLRRLRGRGASTMGMPNDRHTEEYYKQRSVPDKKEVSINRYAQAVAGEMAKMLAEPSVSRAQQRCETLYGAMCEPFRSPKLHSSPRAAASGPTNTGGFATVTTVAANKVSFLSFWAHYLSLGVVKCFILSTPRRIRSWACTHGFLVRRSPDIPAKVEATLGHSQTLYDQSLPVFDAISASSALSEIGKKLKEQMNSLNDTPVTPKPKAPGTRRLHMDSQSIAPFEKKLKKAKVYLEFGSGGSTVRACGLAVPEIHTVETSEEFLDGVIADCQAVGYGGTLLTHFIDIGPTKAWGYPVSRNSSERWPAYCITPWKSLEACGKSPDLILVDGRFRVAAFLYSLLMAKKGATILVDDYEKRNYYHVVEEIIKPIKLHGRMAEFRKLREPNISKSLPLLVQSLFDPR
jgi:hypothetical protein